MSLERILEVIRRELEAEDEARHKAIEMSRTVVRLCRKSILSFHRGEMKEAGRMADRAKNILTKLEAALASWPELSKAGFVYAAYQEYVEARVLLKLRAEASFPTPEELGTPSAPYLLGLSDVVGELRRMALDSIRRGEAESSEFYLDTMEKIYESLMTVDVANALVPGLKSKSDAARRLIEITRGDVTMERRRGSLERSMLKLQDELKRNKRDDED